MANIRFLEAAGDSLAFHVLGIEMRAVQDLYFSSVDTNRSLSLIPVANACSPIPAVSDEIVVDIRIISDADYDEAHPAGSNLAELFDVVVFDEGGIYNERFGLTDYLAREPNTVDEIVLVPNAPPEVPGLFSFTVTYEQEGSGLESFEFTTEPVTLLQSSMLP